MNSTNNKTTRTIAVMGPTKNGKTTFIASLAVNPVPILNCSKGDRNRTKVTIAYHFDVDAQPEIVIERAEFFTDKLKFYSFKADEQIAKFNELISTDGGLLKTLGFNKVAPGTNLGEYVDSVIRSFDNAEISENLLREIITTEGMDKYIKRITLKTKPNAALAAALTAQNSDLFIRDTRGLLDVMISEENGKKSVNTPSLSELGLDDLDSVIFVSSDNIPNMVQSLYEDVLKTVLRSLPVFLVARKTDMFYDFMDAYSEVSYKNAADFISAFQNGQLRNNRYVNISNRYFRSTISLFESPELQIMENGEFCDTFFPLNTVEFLIPTVDELIDPACTAENAVSSENFSFFQTICTQSFCMMNDMITNLESKMQQLSVMAADRFTKTYRSFQEQKLISKEVLQYDRGQTVFMRPQLTYITADRIEKQIVDTTFSLIGPYGGITTKNNGKLRYASTAVSAVTARRYLEYVAENTAISDEMRESFSGLTDSQLKKLLRKTLRCYLYRFTDGDATIQSYLIVRREHTVGCMQGIRGAFACSDSTDTLNVFRDTIDRIAASFAYFIKTTPISSSVIIRSK